ncbi:universal stress protein [Marmoricola sp. RAF53]|uniref:universal stress protein n=1 Tax=Marmoricola sp. RAF53 TaxID=3233059 RepID=UPI003F9BEDE7
MNINEVPVGAVVVGVDGSPESHHAVEWAARHAAQEGRELVLLHALAESTAALGWMASSGVDPSAYLTEAGVTGQGILDAALTVIAPDRLRRPAQTLVVRGDPRTALLTASAAASTVVVGSRGRGTVRTLLLGSVSAAVARHASCPVVVVRPHHPGTVRRGVLVGADGTEGSVVVLEFAYRQASELGLPLTVVHTVWDALAAAGDPHLISPDDPEYAPRSVALAETLAGLEEKYPDVRVTRSIVRGAPTEGILALADAMHLVVVGHQQLDRVSRALFGSIALGVLEQAATVVAVVPEE